MKRPQDQTIGSTVPDGAPPDEPRPNLATFREPDHRFALGDELGRGGMGRVLAASDVSLRRDVAIKQVLSADSHDLIRFEREVRITAQLEHPSIVPIYDVGIDAEERPFYVMRRIDGVPLTDRLDGDAGARLALLPNVLSAIDAAAFAHARKIIHRDIKPSNILLGAYGETWLIDWGLARRLDEPDEVGEVTSPASSLPGDQLTIAGHVYGTAAYMPPEQARGEPVDARADVYALGATLFHVLSGRGPFHGVSAAQRIAQAIEGETAPAKLPDGTAPELGAIVGKAMATEPAGRYADARELAADLRAYLAGQLVGAHRYTTRERFVRFLRRHRLAIAIGAVSLAAIAIAATLSISQVIEQRDEANAARATSADRANLTLLEHASSTAEIDPARAIGLLRSVPHTAAYFDRARDIAAKAAAHGIPHGSGVHRTKITGIAVSPDGASIATTDFSGHLSVHTVADGATRTVADLGMDIHSLRWVAGGTKLIATLKRAAIAVIDVASRTHQIYPITGELTSFEVGERDDHVRFADEEHRLWEFAIATGEKRLLFEHVQAAAQHGDHWLLSSFESGIRLVAGDRTLQLSPTGPQIERGLAIDPTGSRFAGVTGAVGTAEVVEWDAEGHELRRWPLKFAYQLAYSGTALYGSTLDGAVFALGNGAYELFRARDRVTELEPIDDGMAIITSEGHLWVADPTGIRDHSLRSTAPNLVELDARHGLAVIGTTSGEVRWWDYRALMPPARKIHNYIPCFIDDHSWFYFEDMQLTERDRQTLRIRRIAESDTFGFAQCLGRIGPDHLAYAGPAGIAMIEVSTGKITKLHHASAVAVADAHTMFLSAERKLLEVTDGALPPVLRYTAEQPITGITSSRAWVIARLADGSLVRIDRATWEQTTIQLPKTAAIEIAPDGVVWLARGRVLYRWSDIVVIYGVMDIPIEAFTVDSNLPVIELTDHTRWRARATGGFARIEVGNPLDLVHDQIVVGRSGSQLDVVRVRTGEQIRYSLPSSVINISVGHDPHVLFVSISGDYLLELVDPVPDDPVLGWSWIDHVSNARVDPETDETSWD